MGKYTLSNLESLSGFKADTIRIWEKRYNILNPNRTLTNRKWYDDDDVKRLINISVMYRHGIRISKIASMSDSEIIDSASFLSMESGKTDDAIGMLVIAMNSLDEAAVNEIILKSVINKGFENTFTEVIFPFLHKVGFMWHIGSVVIGTEHFISNIFRRRLIAAIDSLPPVLNTRSKRILLFLPEGEIHELGLLFYTYLANKKGCKSIYLGQSTPLNSAVHIADEWKADIIITGIQSRFSQANPEKYLEQLSAAFENKKILVAGEFAPVAEEMNIPNISALRNPDDLYSMLRQSE